MTMNELLMAPAFTDAEAAELDRQASTIDGLLENHEACLAAGSRIFRQFGARLWQASGLDPEALLARIGVARDAERPLRLIVGSSQHLPWELLFCDHPDLGFVSRHPWCTVVRRTKPVKASAPAVLARPFRLLLFVAAPDDLDPEKGRLDFEKEQEQLFTCLDRPFFRGEIEIDVAEDGAFPTLFRRLSENRYHAVILSMHGTMARNRAGHEEWGLLFEDPLTWRSAPLAGSDLTAELDTLPHGHRPGLVVLSACRSARALGEVSAIPNVAQRLHENGFDRVLGMRLSVADPAASAYTATLLPQLAAGEDLGRAVTLARKEVASGRWLALDTGPAEDPFGQWTLPVLFDLTTGGCLVDLHLPAEIVRRPPLPAVMIGAGAIELPPRASFVGRRAETREDLRAFMENSGRCLLFTGPGGVGKTTLAAFFIRCLLERESRLRALGFVAPFDLNSVFEALRQEAFDGAESLGLVDTIGRETDLRKRIATLLLALADRSRPLALLLDNLESLQDTATLTTRPGHDDSLWLLRTVRDLVRKKPVRILLTGRYQFPDIAGPGVISCPVPDAPYGDVLNRMKRLRWPPAMTAPEKRDLYQRLGGNHRALEWLAQLLGDAPAKAGDLLAALVGVAAPVNTPEAAVRVVVEAMRENLLFGEILNQLAAGPARLLRAASFYRIPVSEDGLLALETDAASHEQNRQRLLDYSLLEQARTPGLNYFAVPPVVRELLGPPGFNPAELRQLHAAMGRHYRFQGAHVTRRWNDYLEAIHHFRLAGCHGEADELAFGVCDFYYRTGSFAAANTLAEEIIARTAPPPPGWALNQAGMCQKVLGHVDRALALFEQALPMAPSLKDQGSTLNNISQIFKARGDYETALKFLQESLKIQQEIGDRAGQGASLNNISQIYYARGDYKTALKYLQESLEILKEIGDRAGEGTTLNNISQIFIARGDYETALQYLEASLKIQQEIDDRAGMIPTFHNMAHIAMQANDVRQAVERWREALHLAMETQNARGIFHVAGTLGQVLAKAGDRDQAAQLLKQAVQVGQQAGFPGTADLAALLEKMQ